MHVDLNYLHYGYLLIAYQTESKKQKLMIIISSWSEIIIGVPRGSILGLFLLNIFLTDIFLIVKDTDNASYTDDSILLTLYLIMELQCEQE